MVDRQPGVLSQPLDEIAPEPAAPLTRERRDDDLVDALVVHDLTSRGVRVRVHDLAVRVDPFAAELEERTAETPVGVVVLLVVALWADQEKARRALRRPPA